MKKYLYSALLAFFLFAPSVFAADSAAKSLIAPIPDQINDTGIFFGQKQNYEVTFRGNGEAVVYGRLVVSNDEGNTPKESLTLDFGKIEPKELRVFQQELPPVCLVYDPMNYQVCKTSRPADPYRDIYGGYGGSSNTLPTYSRLTTTAQGSKIKIELAKKIEATSSTIVLIGYTSKAFVTKKWGVFHYTFTTPSTSQRIDELNISLNTDSDLVLAGAISQVNYSGKAEDISAPAKTSDQALTSSSLDALSSRLSYASGNLVKTAKSLSPDETYSTSGRYASSVWYLRQSAIGITIIVLILLTIGLFFLLRFARKRKIKRINSILLYAGGSLVSTSLTALAAISMQPVSDQIGYANYGTTMPLIVIAYFLLFVFLLIAPLIWLGAFRGWKSIPFFIAGQAAWMILIIFFYIFIIRTGNIATPPPYTIGVKPL